MKIYLGPYINRATCSIYENYMNKKYGRYGWDENETEFEDFLEKLDDCIQRIYNHTINLYLDKKKRKIKVKIHNYDTWGTYQDLAHIIAPLLERLKENKQGYPFTYDVDVPENLRDGDEDFSEKKWDYVLNEMIWTFKQIADRDNEEEKFFTENKDQDAYRKWMDRQQNGLNLFAKYYFSLWD